MTGSSTTTGGLWAFLATAAAWGWISLLTPCVFPMIPITVSLFLKQGNQSTRKAVQLSLVYSLTIILFLGLSDEGKMRDTSTCLTFELDHFAP